MNGRVISEFAAKVNRTKNHLQNLTNESEQLKKKADKLKKDLEIADSERHKAAKHNENLKQKYLSSKVTTEEGK